MIRPIMHYSTINETRFFFSRLLLQDATGPLPNRRAPRPKITEPLPPKKTCFIHSESEGSLARLNILALNLTEPPPHEKTSPDQLASGAGMNASFALFLAFWMLWFRLSTDWSDTIWRKIKTKCISSILQLKLGNFKLPVNVLCKAKLFTIAVILLNLWNTE